MDLEKVTSTNGDIQENSSCPEKADFEKAISAAKWGKFHILIYVISFIAGFSAVFETTTMSYVFPEAECDLDLELYHKGLLNAITYAGMISSAMIWGFLFDTLGRKKLIVIGSILDAVSLLASAASQSFTALLVSKFFGGFITNGPYAAIQAYVSEFHSTKHRAYVQIILGASMGTSFLILPAIAMAIMPLNLKFIISENFVLHSWNIYLIICSLPAIISGTAIAFLPESPKFLMTTGRNEEALAIFKTVYRINTGKSEDTYPIKELIDETAKSLDQPNKTGQVTANRSKKQAMAEGWQQIKPLFLPPYLSKMFLVCSLMFMILMSLHTLRLWLPQIFQAIIDYTATHSQTESADLCTMVETLQNKHGFENSTIASSGNETCIVNHNNYDVYTNSMIIAAVTIAGYGVAGTLIKALGKKTFLIILAGASGITAISLYFAKNNATTIALASIFVTFGSISMNVVLAIVVDLFPTTLRTMIISMTMMTGRIGAMVGNIFFPLLLASGCLPPFIFVGFVMLTCGFLGFFVPSTENKALQ